MSTEASQRPTLIFILGDQLDLKHPALLAMAPGTARIIMAEVAEESTRCWSAKPRTALFLAAMRHFAQHLRSAGWTVDYFTLGEHPYNSLKEIWQDTLLNLRPTSVHACELGDYALEQRLIDVCQHANTPLHLHADDHFMIRRDDFSRWAGSNKTLRMEQFYRAMRKRHDILMEGNDPVGGQWNFDEDNRESFGREGPKQRHPLPRFAVDDLTRGAIQAVNLHFADHPSCLDDFNWPVTREQALTALHDFIQHRLPDFGRTQDAMWQNEPFLFHSLLSSSLNLKLLNPREVIAATLKAYQQGHVALASAEGFIRQILGWREFIRGVYWLDMPAMAQANHYQHQRALPQWYWTGATQMNCLRQSILQTLRYGYAHHIQRLMVTGNFALLAGLAPQAVCDWYLAVYVDAVDWVERPNTAGMALHATGGRFTSKPYIASGAYIKRMSNYCTQCRYKPEVKTGGQACPYTTLYWNFLIQHEQELRRNPRAALMIKNLARLEPEAREAIQSHAEKLLRNIEQL